MNDTYSFIMRDQVEDVVKNIMESEAGIPLFRYLSHFSIIAISIASLRLVFS